MNRRSFNQSLSAAGALLSLSLEASRSTTPHKQVILILGESGRANMLNCYQKTRLQTPTWTALPLKECAAITLTPASRCAPARSAIWAGIYPHRNGA
jgi:hypothetical protein